ncbi:GtrA family protein [Limosilactobacillus pontis]|uniref:GtrA family protein n=1 Tax=Limosilactobacillus pontis DSM 8475 TaxID=1423794 RepID=A0A922TNZ4_9LACO|nr:GtrA family protein [Limosilactobacillus pontis]KRM37836.1 GtrA family protein [Limosilactobacillus pontis DSM 8475]QFV01350.1 GtrA family protein [Limosilactobacillus pontis]
MTKLVALFNRYRSVIAYLFWGVVTTVVNIVVFQFLSSGVHWNYQLANVIAWFLSVLVAYFTNKVWVFGSHYSTVKAFLKEFFWFYFYRGLTLIMDVIIMYVGISLLKFNSPLQQLIVKIIDNVIVVIANYIFSKWLIFHDNRDIVEHGKDED